MTGTHHVPLKKKTNKQKKKKPQLTPSLISFPYVDIPALASTDDVVFPAAAAAPQQQQEKYYAFYLPHDDRPHGFIPGAVVAQMPWTADFAVSTARAPRSVRLLPMQDGDTTTAAYCNAALAKVVHRALDQGVFAKTLGRKAEGEDFRIMGALDYNDSLPSPSSGGDSPPQRSLVQLRRSAAGLFGIANRGAHMTMYVRDDEDDIRIWVPRRSRHLATYPGLLDNTVAGGVRADETPLECIVHEALEEASLPEAFVRQHVRACGAVTYVTQTGSGGPEGGKPQQQQQQKMPDQQSTVGGYDATSLCVPDVIYVYDLEVPPAQADAVVPTPGDDEVESFSLWGVDGVVRALRAGEFKANTALVLIDFLVRHGLVTEDNEPDYLEIVTRLRRRLPVPLTPGARAG